MKSKTTGSVDFLEELFPEEGFESEDDYKKDFYGRISEAVTWSADWTVETMFAQIGRGLMNLQPDFQRHVAWDAIKQSRFIESLFMGLPIPQLTLAENKSKKQGEPLYIIVDGKQRLTSIDKFMRGELRLSGVEMDHLEGAVLSDLIKRDARSVEQFRNQTIRCVVLKNWISEKLLYTVFYRLNSGSVALSPQELRASLKPGPFMAALSRRVSSIDGIRKIYGNRIPDPRMRDVELLLRFISFNLFIYQYKGEVKDFLDSTCDYFNALSKDQFEFQVDAQIHALDVGVERAFEIFGKNAFRRVNEDGQWEKRLSRAVFDIQVFYFCRLTDVQYEALKRNRGEFVLEFIEHSSSNSAFSRAVTVNTNSMGNIRIRFIDFGNLISDSIHMPLDVAFEI